MEILTETLIHYSIFWSIVGMIGIGALFGIIFCLFVKDSDWFIKLFIMGFSVLVVACYLVPIGCTAYGKKNGLKEYQVTISEDAKFHEIIDNYEVTDIDGKIYTLRERRKEK